MVNPVRNTTPGLGSFDLTTGVCVCFGACDTGAGTVVVVVVVVVTVTGAV
jgi:hypothetical protein